MDNYYFTSESVAEGHPDKLCDQISDTVLDEVLKQDVESRVACETFVSVGLVIVGGEITTRAHLDVNELVRKVIYDVGYTNLSFGFHYKTCAVINIIGRQSPDIAQGVNRGGAGDQGLMTGYACKETPQLMPLPIMLAHSLVRQLAKVRKEKILPYLGPDGKSQVTVEYENDIPKRVSAVVISAQHTEDILDSTGLQITNQAREEIIQKVIIPVIDKNLLDNQTKYFINPTGKFTIGGPQSDTGMTGRKIIVDTYGGKVFHGGGSFSGKDPTKVDRSAAYMARYIAKNIVASGLADKCAIYLAYVIGEREPVSLTIDTFGTGKVGEKKLLELIKKHFDLSPSGIIKTLDLKKPIYKETSVYGHFGREGFSWERTDLAEILRNGD